MEVFSNDELFTKGIYKWTRGTSLGSYFVSSTSSHYDWALKKLKAHQKNCRGIRSSDNEIQENFSKF